MIVISGALVLVALVLLIIGLVSTSLPFVYASIAVSVVSFVFLLIGILQRRNEQLPGEGAEASAPATTTPAPSGDAEGVTAIIPAGRRPQDAPAAVEEPVAAEDAEVPLTGDVLVVTGRPRYHVSGCRYLTGKDADEIPVGDAREQGFTACGVCKPDTVLAEEAAAEPHPQPDEPVPAAEPVAADDPADEAELVDVEPVPVPDPVTAARKTTRAKPTEAPGRTPAVSSTAAAVKKTATKTTARRATRATAPASETVAAPARTAKAAPAKKAAAAKSVPAKGAPAKAAPTKAPAASAEAVVVIPDRDKFHKADCRFVRGVDGTEELSRAQASRRGFKACGVCKP